MSYEAYISIDKVDLRVGEFKVDITNIVPSNARKSKAQCEMIVRFSLLNYPE